MSRKIFITIGVIFNLIQLAFPFWAWTTEFKFHSKVFGGLDIPIYFLLLVVYFLVIGLIYFTRDITCLSWWFAGPNKRIYHSELGELWADIEELNDYSSTKVMTIYKQYWLYSKRITYIEYTDNRDLLISRTKAELDGIYLEKNKKKKKKSENPAFDEWDGYFDKQSERDDKLDKIGI